MFEVRLAQKGDIARQKEIWKLCFGDSDDYIDFYYANRYRENETLLLVDTGQVAAMLTMIPVKTVTPEDRAIDTVMLYAIATDPGKQNRGFASYLLHYCDRYFKANEQDLSVIVPAGEHLFDYYGRRGYRSCFYIREVRLPLDMINGLPVSESRKGTISPVAPGEYNRVRNKLLRGRLYIAYRDEEVFYQKKLSVHSGADIYVIEHANIQGCAAVERISSGQVLVKEILVPDAYLNDAIRLVARQLHAKEYILRTPVYRGGRLGGTTRPFAVVKIHRETGFTINPEEYGYLGFAFD